MLPYRSHTTTSTSRSSSKLPLMLRWIALALVTLSWNRTEIRAWSSSAYTSSFMGHAPLLQRSSAILNTSRLKQWARPTRGATGTSTSTSLMMVQKKMPRLDNWKLLTNGRVVGTVSSHPEIPDGDTITTSPITRPDQAGRRKVVSTYSGSKYLLWEPAPDFDMANGAQVSMAEIQRRARLAFDLNGQSVGDETRQYLLSGKPQKSTSAKSLIYKAYRADEDGLPTGGQLTVKMSTNWEAIEREAENYAKITKAGFWRGQFIELLDFLPTASEKDKKLATMSALVMERGTIDLKKFIAMNGALAGREMREAAAAAAQCLQAVHNSGLVWTDMKTENFVVMPDGRVKGIDLESAMPVKDNPVDYSPEGTPPEFARALLSGDGPYFVLQYNYDVWSYGMLLFELSTGKGYFDGKTPVQTTKALRDGPVIKVDAIPDAKLRDLVQKCLQLDPRARPSILQILLHPYFFQAGFGPISF